MDHKTLAKQCDETMAAINKLTPERAAQYWPRSCAGPTRGDTLCRYG
jgi:hypothetical protein